MAASLAFYGALGFEFVEEQHGTGPVHYSCQLNGMVIELFPGKPGTAPDRRNSGATMIGFQINDLDDVLENLDGLGAVILTQPQVNDWGRRVVVEDPDGRAIELNQPASDQ
jgi:catechol 2,3-dioxygenase-like lactoylglutathione lyase family enzyme